MNWSSSNGVFPPQLWTDAEGMEKDADTTMRTRVFYCDPMRAGQKGSLENNHEELRYILPKGVKDLRAIGFTGQDKLNLILSNINSAPQAGQDPRRMQWLQPVFRMPFQ